MTDYATLLADIKTTACTLSDKSQQVALDTQGSLTEQQVYIFQMVTNSAARFLNMTDTLITDYQVALASHDDTQIAERGEMTRATLLHDMRSPLTIIVSAILLLIDDEFEPAPLNADTKLSLREIQNLAHQILALMNF